MARADMKKTQHTKTNILIALITFCQGNFKRADKKIGKNVTLYH